jgi:hypothetical protein
LCLQARAPAVIVGDIEQRSSDHPRVNDAGQGMKAAIKVRTAPVGGPDRAGERNVTHVILLLRNGEDLPGERKAARDRLGLKHLRDNSAPSKQIDHFAKARKFTYCAAEVDPGSRKRTNPNAMRTAHLYSPPTVTLPSHRHQRRHGTAVRLS